MKNTAAWMGRFVLGGLFVHAAMGKIADPAAFATDVDRYRLLTFPLTRLVALYLPWLQLLCAAALVFRRLERGALMLMLTMFAVFIVALFSAWFRNLDITCGCFGRSGSSRSLLTAIARNAGLMTIAWTLLRTTESSRRSNGVRPLDA